MEAPLPPGVRRFRLDPARYREKDHRLLAIIPVVGATILCNLAIVATGSSLPVYVIGLALVLRILFGRDRRPPSPAHLATYELFVGPRVLRRTEASKPPAEVLRPEVSAIVETRDGLHVSCDAPPRSLFLSRALDGYEDVRAELGAWRAIEPLRGWAAWRRASDESHEGPRDAISGTSLASDPSLAHELELVRSASSMDWRIAPEERPPRSARRMLVAWVVLLVLFVAVWQLLQPAERPPARRPSRPAASAS
jgi:hypothetical protein